MDLSVEVRDPAGSLVHTEDRELIVELSATQMEAAQASPFAFQGSFPLVPGDFDASVVLRNRVMTRFTVAEAAVSVPESRGGGPVVSDPVLVFDVELGEDGRQGAFSHGRHRFRPAAGHLFSLGDSLTAGVQVGRAESGSTVRMTLGKGGETLRERELPAGNFEDGGGHAAFDLTGLETGSHWFRVELRDARGTVAAARDSEFQLIPRVLPRASYVHRSGAAIAAPGVGAVTRGNQLLALGRVEAARAEYERAVAANPDLPMARWRLASLYLRTESADRVLELLTPLEAEHGDQYEVVAGLGFAHYFEQRFADAARYLERAASLRPPGAVLLNALGEAHEQSGDLERAGAAFERSLGLEPNQPAIAERLARIRAQQP
ncbi:MAG: tetratricopeptide repeat protein [Gemmatimonadetes bacterium]|nr:tetratricopeptide repeat protein [Gemmatimonadota bacterium]